MPWIEDEDKVDSFYKDMEKFYRKPSKHASPTRRLRQQIDTAFEQKAFLAKQDEFRADRNDDRYQLTYVVGVSKTYVVQPESN